MPDTSLTAIIDSKNDRHVFFQENTGLIRHAWFISSSNQWTTFTNQIVTSDAKNYTPMSALSLNPFELPEMGVVSYIFERSRANN